MAYPKGEAILDGEKVEFKEGALRSQLKVPREYKFSKADLRKLDKIEVGKPFTFLGKEFKKKTPLMGKRIKFALVLMK